MYVLCYYIYYCRFLEQITVCDVSTNQIFQFICNDWLTPDKGVDVATYKLKLRKELPYTYTLRVRSLQSLRDKHLWLSIFVCPRHSTFTRAQRLSCGFAFVTSAMLANIMFYDSNRSRVHEELIFDAIKLDLSQLIIGAQCAAMTFPVSMLSILIFRFVRSNNAQLNVTYGDNKSSDPTSQSATTTSFTDDSNSDNNSIFSDGNDSSDSNSDSSDLDEPKRDMTETGNKGTWFRLPWWFTYIGWALTIGTSVVSSYVVLMYGLTFGLNKSVAWLVSFLASATHSIGIFQPLKVAVIVIIMTLIFKAPVGPVADITHSINLGRYWQI